MTVLMGSLLHPLAEHMNAIVREMDSQGHTSGIERPLALMSKLGQLRPEALAA